VIHETFRRDSLRPFRRKDFSNVFDNFHLQALKRFCRVIHTTLSEGYFKTERIEMHFLFPQHLAELCCREQGRFRGFRRDRELSLVSFRRQGSFPPVNQGVHVVKPCLSKYQVMRDGSNYVLQYRWMPMKSEQGFRE
jgi:hypothetical protein